MREIKTKKEVKNNHPKCQKMVRDIAISEKDNHKSRASMIKREIDEGIYIVKSEDIAIKIVQKMKDRFFYKIS